MTFYISVITMEVYLGRNIKKERDNCLEIFLKDCLLLKKEIWYLVEHVHNIRYSACVGRIVFRSGRFAVSFVGAGGWGQESI